MPGASPVPSRNRNIPPRTDRAGEPKEGVEPLSPSEGPGHEPGAFAIPGPHVCSAPMEQIEMAIRWRDVDNYGHVNNAVYLTYLEECRDRWVRRILGDDLGFVIVRVAIDFRRELSLEDGSVTAACWGTGYGTSSIRTAETIRAKTGWIAAESESVIVAHDAGSRRSRPITDRERSAPDAAIEADRASVSPGGPGDRT